jgi:hypothetical protein
MSASELESLGLDAAVITKLQTVINSDQVDNGAIIADVLGDNVAIVPATVHIQGNNVKVDAPTILKNFKGEWNRALGLYFFFICGTTTTDSFNSSFLAVADSRGRLNYKEPLKGQYRITVTLNRKNTVILFTKALLPPPPRPDAVVSYFSGSCRDRRSSLSPNHSVFG